MKIQRALMVLTGVLGWAALTGCGGGEDEPNPLATRNGFCLEWAKRACNDDVVEACSAASPEACRAAQEEHCQSVVSADAERERDARACLDAVRSALSDARLSAAEVGTVLRGEGPCGFSCVEVAGGGCVEPTVVSGGEECSSDDVVCDEGFFCDGDNCLAKRAEGRDCTADIPCRDGLKCVGEAGAQVCEAKVASGGDCVVDDDCVSGICAEGANVCAGQIILSTAEPTCASFR